jgi:ABC-type transport system involved in multi-copper enzyme maturation permease subunit
MKFLNLILSILLVLGFLIVPNSVFAIEHPSTSSATFSENSISSENSLNSLNPMVKSSGSKSSGSSKKIKIDDDDESEGADDGSSIWLWIIVIIVIVAVIFGIWYFLLRNR